MSAATSNAQALDWKQEVNRRLAEHRGRKGSFTQPAVPSPARTQAEGRAAQAAARVAARFAQAPSYNQMQAAEARAAMREAEIATQVALEAQAKAKAALANLQQAASRIPEPVPFPAPPPMAEPAPEPVWESRLKAEPEHQPEPEAAQAVDSANAFAWPGEVGKWHGREESADRPVWEQPRASETAWDAAPAEPVQPIAANLIEFPRQIVATRKVRPRLAEGPLASMEPERQLSIFEVDPGSVATGPEAVETALPAQTGAWTGPDWSGMMLDAEAEPEAPAEPVKPERVDLQVASAARRLMAVVVDSSLIVGAFTLAGYLAVSRMAAVPPARTAELGAAAALVLVAVLYYALFGLTGQPTPGMRYARLRAFGFDGKHASAEQVRRRTLGLLLSVLPLGLGVLWAVFDDDRLCWHDRLSATCLRKA